MHSTGSMRSLRHLIARPAHCAGTSVPEMTWLAITSVSWPNHHSDSCVSTRPLSGIGVGRTTSYTLTRSEATMMRSPPSAYRSRTFPEYASSTHAPHQHQKPTSVSGNDGPLLPL